MKQISYKHLLHKKIQLLNSLITNLKREEELLSYRDADTAVKIEFKNETLVRKLEELDAEILEHQELDVHTEEEIALSETVFSKLDEARTLQQKVQELLVFEMNESKKEYWEFSIKRRLKSHLVFSSGLSWTKNYC
ncbi:flagellar protein FlgN [Leptospira levettii]|uniref:Flagellar protein FlgN n=1 Tax=Leptospira levettii TaxID=2023178 RepID=A0ABY2MK09_9LEPT|nr:flagellar protein FlgN [Leptospira levettii]PKA27320.1 flagellar protein FlgN [Leptospira sp. mixed culture ATI2-C-A1]MCG6148677.1 flagellar protein FlgN [Leptospira levettii]MCW7472636.1 flagellar protein FlgN [Leptospira levettii]MCW7508716.1 flagellar protein FlgN [Leptospira levettii]MCW7519806.1 flagellar protein FlgN [Leptospira levettii]